MTPTSFLVFLLASVLLFMQTNAATLIKSDRAPARKGLEPRVEIGGSNFTFALDDWVHWYDAHARCGALGLQLLTLDTEEKYTMMYDWLNVNPDYDQWWWTSGLKPAWSPEFQWTTSRENFTFTAWGPGQPSRGLTAESCMDFAVWWGGWDDDTCMGTELRYICEQVAP